MNNRETKKIALFKKLCNLLDSMQWSIEMINEAEKQSKLDANYHKLLFPNGQTQLVQEFENWLDTEMLNALEKIEKPKKIREQIALALETRIINLVSKNVILKNSSFLLLFIVCC